MDNILALMRAARVADDPGSLLRSEAVLNELLSLNEKMIEQLRLEQIGAVGNTDFLTGMIEQHQKTAEDLRLELKNRKTNSS